MREGGIAAAEVPCALGDNVVRDPRSSTVSCAVPPLCPPPPARTHSPCALPPHFVVLDPTLRRDCVPCSVVGSCCGAQSSNWEGADFTNAVVDRVSFDGSSMKVRDGGRGGFSI